MSKELLNSASPISIESIYAAIRDNGFSEQTTQLIDNFTNDILNGKTNLTQFNQAEHAGLCCAGAVELGQCLDHYLCNFYKNHLKILLQYGFILN